MNVLGVSPLDKDATVSIVQDGRLTYAAAEERFTRVKLQSGFPHRALHDAFAATGLKPDDIDEVVYPFFEWQEETRLLEASLAAERTLLDSARDYISDALIAAARHRVPARQGAIPGLRTPNEQMEKGTLKNVAFSVLANDSAISRRVAKHASAKWGLHASAAHRQWHYELESSLADLNLQSKLKRVEHHASHAANAYYTSGFDEALIVTLDGYGSGLAGSISRGSHGTITRIHSLPFPHSLGTFYEAVTSALGLTAGRHEGKVVGLAAYGDPAILRDVLLSRFQIGGGSFRIVENNNIYFARLLASRFPKIDVAAAYQHVLETVACAYVSEYVRSTGLKNMVLSGGVVANVKLNQRLREIPGVEKLFVHPNMGDGGCGTGAALLSFAAPGFVPERLPDVFLGPGFSEREIAEACARAQLPVVHHADPSAAIAALIANGHVVARFDGRMEYGPRALGNRSILYHARDAHVNQWLNRNLGRTEFMPFAPATLYEKRHECYEHISGAEAAASFMTVTVQCTPEMKGTSPAAVHVDGTARPQLVHASENPGFHKILSEYYKLTGIPSVINTSFNMHEEPIVCTPDDAIRAFIDGNLDYLAMGPFIAAHPSPQKPRRRHERPVAVEV